MSDEVSDRRPRPSAETDAAPALAQLQEEVQRLKRENAHLHSTNEALSHAHRASEKARLILEDNEANLRKVLDSAPIAVGICEVQTSRVLYLNDSCAAMFGPQMEYMADAWVDQDARHRFEEEFGEGVLPSREVLFRRADGDEFWGVATWRSLHYQGQDCVLYWVYDTDRRKRAEEQLLFAYDNLEKLVAERTIALSAEVSWRKRVENELRRTLNSLDDAVIAVDGHGAIERMNAAAERLSGHSFQNSAGKPFESVLRARPLEGQGALSSLRAAIETGEPVVRRPSEYRLEESGDVVVLSESASPIRDSQGTLVGAVTIIRDVTEQHRLEQQLRHVQKMESIGQLAGGVAHDFNNMLGAILGAAELLSLGAGDAAENVQIIISTSERAAGLTRKLLSFSRKTSSEKRSFDLNQAISDAVSMMVRAIDRRTRVVTKLHDTALPMVGDMTALQNAVLNLGINGAHAMPDGGPLTIVSTMVDLGEDFCKRSAFSIAPGPFAKVVVQDTGQGMTADVLERVFEPFFTTKAPGKGTGLGLSAVYGTVTGHQGAISIYSEPGRGTAVHLYLPLSQAKLARRDRRMPRRGEGLVMVVDDEPAIRITAKGMLESLGYDVIVAENGREGLRLFHELREELRLVLLDVVMPEMAGDECLRAIRDQDPHLPVLMSSGFTRDTAVIDLKSLGISGFVEKPFTLRRLADAVSQALRVASSSPSV